MKWIVAALAVFLLANVTTYAEPVGPIEQTIVTRGEGHFPVAVRLKDNRIAVVLRGGGPHLSIHGRLDIVFSSDEGKTWTKPTIVASDPAADVRNPAFGRHRMDRWWSPTTARLAMTKMVNTTLRSTSR